MWWRTQRLGVRSRNRKRAAEPGIPKRIGRGPLRAQYPVEAITRLAGARHIAAVKLYGWLLHLDWKNDHRPFKLTNEVVAPLRMDRKWKGFALRELQELGLIQVESIDPGNPPGDHPPMRSGNHQSVA